MEPDGRASASSCEKERLEDEPGNHPRAGTHSSTIAQQRQEFLDLYRASKVVVVSGEPGCGKSTQIPEFVLSEEPNSGKRVASVQPNKTTTTLLANRVAAKVHCEVGNRVGYNIPGDGRTTDETLLEFTTAENLLWKLQGDGMLSTYSCIIIDEVDQRTKATDILLMALKDLLPFRSAFKVVIICSAYETSSLLTYFDELAVSTMTTASHNKPAIVQYCPKLDGRVLTDMVELVLEIEKVEHEMHLALAPTALGHILVVLATANDVKLFCSQFGGRETALEIVPFREDLNIDEQRKIFISSPRQRCFLSTEPIKNSYYVDGVSYVVDSGLIEIKFFNPAARMEVSSIESVFKRMLTDGPLEHHPMCLLRTSMASEILLLKALDYRSMNDLQLLDPPGPAIVAAGFCELETLDLLDDDHFVTEDGTTAYRCMTSDSPISPVWFKAVVEGFRYGVQYEILCLAAIFNSPRPIFGPTAEGNARSNPPLGRFVSHQSDHLGYMHALYAYERVIEEEPDLAEFFCLESSLDRKALEAIVRFRDQLLDFFSNLRLGAVGRPKGREETRCDFVKKVLAKSFSHHAAFLDYAIHGLYKIRSGGCTSIIKETSSLAEFRPKHVMTLARACCNASTRLCVRGNSHTRVCVCSLSVFMPQRKGSIRCGSEVQITTREALIPESEPRVVPEERRLNISWKSGLLLITFIVVMVLRGVLPNRPLLYGLFGNMYLAGTIIFGGGPVVIPLLREYIVDEG
ncbi:unnamed protein product [Clonostachys chloroleuca]|uniref:Helicase ATP-binding domain-containing protein n=1 Tax=Clonostachys chloroleuca TaxID=1926264 RepID=A0AA35VGW1_9HYPO|nr:unnamed protein product [Clonostachys chloroleuca]